MLAPSRNHRAEVKYNVTTDFPHLGLHSASASGDIGLVQYALSHGQPVNSVLDGVLPLHAACAGGNVLVVKLLIEHGADANAPRLPRRYSDRNRDATAPIVGTSGSTPLHFAAANGHLTVVRMLLSHGALPDRADKHAITPELIARQNGWIECADVLAHAVASMKERDRTARGDTPDSEGASRERSGSLCPTDYIESSLRKRLHIKRSIDHALNALKSTSVTPDKEPKPPFVHSSSSEQEPPAHDSGDKSPYSAPPTLPTPSGRRPSLPQIFDEPPHRPSFTSRSRRPRSAGTGAEPAPPRKLNSKLSLLSLFKKTNADGSSSSLASEQYARSPPSPSPIPSNNSPAFVPPVLPVSPRSIPIPLSSSPRETSHLEFQRRRLESSTSSSGVGAYPADLHSTLTVDRSRHCSVPGASVTSTPGEDQMSENAGPSSSAAPVRPGILRMHNRSSSSGHGSATQPASLPRIIRFGSSTSSNSSPAGRTRSPSSRGGQSDSRMRGLSASSGGQWEDEFGGVPDTIEESPLVPAQPAPPIFVDTVDDNDEELEEEYGVPLTSSEQDSNLMLSPERSLAVSQLPFSINVPPPTDDILSGSIAESRLRGDSVSSASTTATTSTYPQSSSSDAAWSVATPSTPHLSPSPLIISNSAELEADGETMRGAREPRRPHTPLDIDITSISSHAQAEALVQRTQQSILNMEQYLEQHVRKDSDTGRTPLSAKLAAYGESLAIERQLKQGVDPKTLVNGSTGKRHGGGGSLLSTSRPTGTHIHLSRSSSESGSSSESTSLEDRPDHVRRAGRSASDDIRHAQSFRGYPSSPTTPEQLLYSPPRRSRTPDPDLDSDLMRGIPLSRVSTTPCHETTPSRRGRDRDTTRSAQKLTRMGFSTIDNWQPSPYKGGTSRSPPPRHRFGGIRTIMQSFQGK
ncbi:hypothetical protein HYDPIDRAFT_25969 [Hydnomerulius pinastri MD-312]|nr:hypothetical protein HYDPIDRAFT_25969 [Hydnomerulius pinastri MD-312]